MLLSLPLTGALLLSALSTVAVTAFPDMRACLRAGRGRHRRVVRGRHALRGGVR